MSSRSARVSRVANDVSWPTAASRDSDGRTTIPSGTPMIPRGIWSSANAKLKSEEGSISLVVHPKCKELIVDFERVAWADGLSEIEKGKDQKRTHLSDALGYLVWQEFQPAKTVGERGERLYW